MRNNIAGLRTRVGMVALASLGVLAAPSGAAAAATTAEAVVVHTVSAAAPSPAQCNTIRQQIEALEARELSLQDLLAEATPAQKPGIIKMILRLEAQIAQLQAQLAGCPA